MPYMICSAPSSLGFEVGDELHELVGLPVEVQPVQRLQGEGRVAHPGVAVVPVPLASGRLRQRRRERGHGRAGRHVREALDRQRRTLDRLPPPVIGDPRPVEPVPPEHRPWPRCSSLGLLVVLGGGECRRPTTARRRAARRHAAGGGPGRGGPRRPSDMSVRKRIVTSAPTASAAWFVPSTSVHSPAVAAVVEHRLADQLHRDATVEALGGAHQHVTRHRRRRAAVCAA